MPDLLDKWIRKQTRKEQKCGEEIIFLELNIRNIGYTLF